MKNFIERLEAEKAKNPENQFAEGFNFALTRVKIIYNELHPQTETIAPEPNKQHTEGSFKVRVTNSRDWYSEKDTWYVKIYDEKFYVTVPEVGCQEGGERILKSDCEIIPETPLTILEKFNAGWDITHFENGSKAVQVIEKKVHHPEGKFIIEWDNGNFCAVIDEEDGVYFHSKPKAKQVTTYHYIESTGYVRGSSMSKHELVNLIGETTTEQQENGEWKIVKTTLK